MLRQAQQEKLSTQKAVLQYIGERFRVKLGRPAWYTDTQVALFLLRWESVTVFRLGVFLRVLHPALAAWRPARFT